jgi:hypothetical protein
MSTVSNMAMIGLFDITGLKNTFRVVRTGGVKDYNNCNSIIMILFIAFFV